MSLLSMQGFILAAGRKPSEGTCATDPVMDMSLSCF